MLKYIKKAKQRSRTERERIALIAALLLTVLIVGGWFIARSTLSFNAPSETVESQEKVNPFSLIKRSFSRNFDRLQESVGFGFEDAFEDTTN